MANRGRTYDKHVHSIKDLEKYGSEKMSKSHREYYNEGAMDLITLRENELAFDRYKIRPRVLRDVSTIDTSTTILGTKVKFPFGFSPTAMQALAHPDGEIATSKACASAGILMGLSTYSTIRLEDVIAHANGNPYVMQMSLLNNKDAMIQLIKRAEGKDQEPLGPVVSPTRPACWSPTEAQSLANAWLIDLSGAGFKALFITLDAPYLGRRLNEYRNNFGVPRGMEYPNIFPGVDVTNLEDSSEQMGYDSSLEWPELVSFLRRHTNLEIWGKGIYTAQDAELAITHGFDGIVVSNHGGRQLDSVPASLDVLRDIVPAVKGRVPVAVDGGFRRGTDIFKALALGANFCLAGRPAIWGLAYDGQRGVGLAINLLFDEFQTCMALAGLVHFSIPCPFPIQLTIDPANIRVHSNSCRNVAEICKDHLTLLQANGLLARL
ncbi:hypothetical protein TPAR_02961 [Tolypocladium paradoxum]|uniref:FMN hydroxy acid dehydrogenase domain-containing protein n=1 Tax=Tolypocladium paradoxum TaxID=94208 RepID=A0A2S4L302_9HYPO|nr:hypothetical protein TPAR_02961 [Tolypocladium paradoxum]